MKDKNENPLKISIEEAMNLTPIELNRKIELWKRFISKQKVIRFFGDKNEIALLQKDYDAMNSSFAVVFPKSFPHLKDFQNGLPNASSTAYFQYDGSVTVFIGKENQITLGYFDAWDMILLRTTSKSFKFLSSLKIPKENLDAANIEEIQNGISKRIKDWIDQFNKIPGVNAQLYTGHDADKIIDINLPGSLDAFIHGNDEPTFCIALMTNQKFHDYYTDGKIDSICSKWREDLKTSNVLDWEGVYHCVSTLINQYLTAIPKVSAV